MLNEEIWLIFLLIMKSIDDLDDKRLAILIYSLLGCFIIRMLRVYGKLIN